MTRTKWILTGALFALAVFALVLAPTSALAAKKNMAKVKGYISNIDPLLGQVEITYGVGNAVTVDVVEGTKIHKNNVEGAAFGDLAVGDKATAKYNTETGDAKRIQAKSPKAHGVITAVGDDSVTIRNAQGVEVTVDVTEDTVITLNDEPATLEQLKDGDHAKAKYDFETGEAKFVHASNLPDDGED